MKKHIAFIIESAHGHINPTLAIASNLIGRDHRVTYAVKTSFAPRITSIGAEAVIYSPLESKLALFHEMAGNIGGAFPFDFERADSVAFKDAFQRESEDTFSQLLALYRNDRPDLIIYDSMNPAGRSLASAWNIPSIEHSPMMINPDDQHDAEVVIVSLPRFLQEDVEALGDRFHFVGPANHNSSFFKPWTLPPHHGITVLVSATTGLLPQIDFYTTAIGAFTALSWRIILSIGDDVDPGQLGPLPPNFVINQFSSQAAILEQASLFVGQGGPASILEALRCGVPLLLSPPSQVHDMYSRRIEALGLGVRLLPSDFTATAVRTAAISVLQDRRLLRRVAETRKELLEIDAARAAADLIDGYLRGLTVKHQG